MASGLAYRKKKRNRKSHVDKMMLKRSIENGDEENWNSLCKLYFIGNELERERAIEETGKFIQFRPKSNNFKLLPKCYILIHFQPDAESADHNALCSITVICVRFFSLLLLCLNFSRRHFLFHIHYLFECLYSVLLAVQPESC